jgi:hypothetical protein
MLGSLKIDLAKAIEGKTACLFLSGGSDSLLLLHVLLELDVVFSVMTMDATFSREQKKVIDDLAYERNLRVFTYKPKAAYFIGDGKGKLAFVEEYGMLAGETIPFVRDCVGGKKCSYDVTVETREFVPIGYEINIFGTRRTDRHWSWGKAFAKAGSAVDIRKGDRSALELDASRRCRSIERLRLEKAKGQIPATMNFVRPVLKEKARCFVRKSKRRSIR